MVIELDDDEARLLYAVVLEKAQEHFSYANRSELGDRLSTLASRIARTSRELKAENYNYVEVGLRSYQIDNLFAKRPGCLKMFETLDQVVFVHGCTLIKFGL